MKLRGVWVGIAAAVCGIVATALIESRGGQYEVVMPHLALVLPLTFVGAITALAALGVGRPRINAAIWLGVIAVAGAVWNTGQYFVLYGNAAWDLLLPLAKPTGLDFRDGLYVPGRAFSNIGSSWPPLTVVVGRAFSPLSFESARLVQGALLIALAVGVAALSGMLAVRAISGPHDLGAEGSPSSRQVSLIMGFWLLTSYGFLFEVERGNIDLYALFLSLLFVWTLFRFPKSVWLPSAILAAAINLKLYPATLLLLLLWRFRWRALLPVIACGGVLLFLAGPANVWNLFKALPGRHHGDFLGWANHSATSYAHVLSNTFRWLPSWFEYPLLLIPLVLWTAIVVIVIRRGWSEKGAVLVAGACVMLMPIIPPVSNDYSLVVVTFPLAVLVVAVATMRGRSSVRWSLLFGIFGMALFYLSRSSRLNRMPSLTGSKYSLLLLLLAILLAVVLIDNGSNDRRGASGQVVKTPAPPRIPEHDAASR
jgi:hypothetical protein